MSRYVSYDPSTGGILQSGNTLPAGGVAYIETVQDGSLGDYCVVDGDLVEKASMTLGVPADPVAADGVTEAIVSGLPAGTTASFLLGGNGYYITVDDGLLEISAYDPQTVTVQFWHPSMTHPPVELVFV